jgi:hypothetical protein
MVNASTAPRMFCGPEYRRLCELLGLEPDERLYSPVARAAALPDWIGGPLVATEPAREKLHAWATSTPQPWTSPTPADVLQRFAFAGDVVLAHVTARLIAERLPPPVAAYVSAHVSFIGLGLQIQGFASAHVDATDRPRLVVLSYPGVSGQDDEAAMQDFEDVVAHEVSHCWLMPEPKPGVICASSFWMQTVHDLPMADVPPEDWAAVDAERARYKRHERLARGLTAAWGFRDK